MGVNEFRTDSDTAIPIHVVEPALEKAQVGSLQLVRAERNSSAVRDRLSRLAAAAESNENLMPFIVEAVEAYASIGEICDVFRRVHGEFREAVAL